VGAAKGSREKKVGYPYVPFRHPKERDAPHLFSLRDAGERTAGRANRKGKKWRGRSLGCQEREPD